MKKLLTAVFLLFLSAASCMASQTVSVILDWVPNVDHVPLFVARDQGFFRAEGLDVRFLTPSDTTDALKLAASGKVDLAVGYAPQVIIAVAEGLPVTVAGRLIEHPLSVVLFLGDKGITSPKDLKGKRIGYTVPGVMDVLLDAFLAINGVRNASFVNVGFSIVQSLASGQVDAVMGGFRNVEAVELERLGMKPGTFPLEEWGIPDYDELVLVGSPALVKAQPGVIRAFRRGLERGILETREHPVSSFAMYLKSVPEAQKDAEQELFLRTLPFYALNQRLEPARWKALADFALEWKLIRKPVDVRSCLWIEEVEKTP